MYFHLSDHIYLCQFGEESILLDTLKDQYRILSKNTSTLLKKIIEDGPYELDLFLGKENDLFPRNKLYLQKLLDNNTLQLKPHLYPYYIDRKPSSLGVANVDWRLPLDKLTLKFNLKVINALFMLIKVNFYMKLKGFYYVINMIKKSILPNIVYTIPNDKELVVLANNLNKACLIYPTRTKCLEWAITYVLLALRHGWKCNLEIGVQNYPFFAHAWVECHGNVVMDTQDLRDGLSIILNEPFRKLKS